MESFYTLLAICVGNSPVTGEFPEQMPVTWSFDVFFDLRLNKRLSKQSWGWWFETPLRPLWRHCNAVRTIILNHIQWFNMMTYNTSWRPAHLTQNMDSLYSEFYSRDISMNMNFVNFLDLMMPGSIESYIWKVNIMHAKFQRYPFKFYPKYFRHPLK